MRVPLYEAVPIELVMSQCWVMDLNTYCKVKLRSTRLTSKMIRLKKSVDGVNTLRINKRRRGQIGSCPELNPFIYDRVVRLVRRSSTCTSASCAWTARRASSRRCRGPSTPSAPSPTPSTTSRSASR